MRQNEHVAGAHGPSHDARVGATIAGRYRIEERIAAGGFGAIYRATDVITGVPVALKILHRHLVADLAIVGRFVREAELLREQQSPQAVTVYASGLTTEGAPYLAMELLTGETLLARFMACGRLPWREVVAIARGVCGALAEPHALGIVHRDLKPANIFLQARGRQSELVRVLDFGIAKRIESGALDGDLTRQGELVGTLDYMAPEQIVGGTTAAQADIFTLGIVMYEMIAGVRPFGDPDGAIGQLAALLGSDPVPLARHAEVPADLERVIARCLHREPQERYATVGQLDDALAQLVDDEADTVAMTPLEDDDTWIGEMPFASTLARLPEAMAVEHAARTRFAQGTSGESNPYVPTAPHLPTPPSMKAVMLGVPQPPNASVGVPAQATDALVKGAPARVVRMSVPPPSARTSSIKLQVALGCFAVVLGAAAAFLAFAC